MALLLHRKIWGIFLLLIFAAPAVWGQASFKSTITPGAIGKTETAVLRLIIENANEVEQIVPPSLEDFIILSGPNQESGMESVNGVTRQYIGIAYLLQPKRTGRFTIRGATAKADGRTLKSNPVTLQVGREPTGNSQPGAGSGFGGFSPFPEPAPQSSFNDYILREGENVAEKIDKNIFLNVEMSKPTCYVGEPVVVTYKLYTRLKSESSITKNPSFNGFSVIDLLPPGSNNYTVEKFNGREYNVYTLRKSQLYPLQAGPVALESAEVENDIHFIKEAYARAESGGLSDLFRDFAQTNVPPQGVHNERVSLQSKPAVIQVKALPENGKPATFKGAVGNFVIASAVDKNQLSTDDAAKLTIAVKGEGNMSMIISPDISWPEGIEPYDSRATEQIDKLSVPVSGIKYFEFPFTVADSGSYTLPPVNFSYFDVTQGEYITVSTDAINIQVSKGTGKPAGGVGAIPATADRKTFFDTIFTNRWLIIIPIIILVLAGLLIWVMKDRRAKPSAPPKTEPAPVQPALQETAPSPLMAANPLAKSEICMEQQDARAFYTVLNKEFKQFLAVKFAIPPENINKKTIEAEADKKGIAVHTSLEIQSLLETIEWQLYTPFAEEAAVANLYQRADFIVQELNKNLIL